VCVCVCVCVRARVRVCVHASWYVCTLSANQLLLLPAHATLFSLMLFPFLPAHATGIYGEHVHLAHSQARAWCNKVLGICTSKLSLPLFFMRCMHPLWSGCLSPELSLYPRDIHSRHEFFAYLMCLGAARFECSEANYAYVVCLGS
jgi:hypothetical protein